MRPMRPSHDACESILQVQLCPLRELEFETFETITAYTVTKH